MYKFLILCFLLSGCAVAVPKTPICTEISPIRAYCVNTVTSEEFYIDDTHKFEGKSYWEQRQQMLLLPASSWVEIKKFIIKICKQSNKCDTQIGSWNRTVDAIDKQLSSKER